MIFAVLDLASYLLRRGRFSTEAMEARGRKLATEKNFQGWRQFPVGTIMYSARMNSKISWLIMYADNATASHCAAVVNPETLLDVTGQGVHHASISEYFDGASYLTFYDASRSVSVEHADAVSKRLLGQPYGYGTILRLAVRLVVGRHTTLAWRIVLDTVLTGVALAILWNELAPTVTNLPAYLGAVYLSILAFNLLFYRPKAVKQFTHRHLRK